MDIRDELRDIKEKLRTIKIMILSLENRIEKIEKQLTAKETLQQKIQQPKKPIPPPPISESAKELLREKPVLKKKVEVPRKTHTKITTLKEQKPSPIKALEPAKPKESIEKPTEKTGSSSIEMFLGGSLFLRFGLLFLIIASITFSYWLYIEVILKLSIIQKILLAYSIGTITTTIGIKTLMEKNKWFGESLAGAGMASLVGVSIMSYHMEVLNKNIFGVTLFGLLIICISLAKRFRSLALLLEAVMGSILAGFFIAWMYPSRPYAQLYMMMLFVMMFNRVSEKMRTGAWFISSAYSLLFFISLLQWLSMQTHPIIPLDLQVVSLSGPSIIYLFYSTQKIDRRLNTIGFQALAVAVYILFNIPLWIFYIFIVAILIGNSIIAYRSSISPEPKNMAMELALWFLFFIALATQGLIIDKIGAPLLMISTFLMIGKVHWGCKHVAERVGWEDVKSVLFTLMLLVYLMNTLTILFTIIEEYVELILLVQYLSIFLIAYPDATNVGESTRTYTLKSLGAISYILATVIYPINPLLELPSIYILGTIEHLSLITKSKGENGRGIGFHGFVIFLGTIIITLRVYLSILAYLLPAYFILSTITLDRLSIRKNLKIGEEALLIRIVYPCILQGILNILARDLVYLNIAMMVAIYLATIITTKNISLPYFLCIYLGSITYYIIEGTKSSLLYLFYLITVAISGSIIQRRRNTIWKETYYYAIIPAIVLALNSIHVHELYLVALTTLSFSFSHQIIPAENRNMIHNSISIYTALSIYKMLSKTIIISILGTSIDYFVLLFLTVYTFFTALSMVLQSIGTINANMIIFPFIVILLFKKMEIYDIFYLVEGIVIITSLALYKLRGLREKKSEDIMLEILLLLTYSSVTAILCSKNIYTSFIIYTGAMILLYYKNVFFQETSPLYVLASHIIVMSAILTLTTSIYLIAAMGYSNTIILTLLNKKLRHSKEITLNLFPMELVLLSYISTIETINTMLIPTTLIIQLIVTQKIYPSITCITTMFSYTTIATIEAAPIFTTYTLIILAPLALYAYRTNPNVVLLDAPSMLYAITHMGMSPYLLLLLPTMIYIMDIRKDLFLSPKSTTYMVVKSLIQYFVIAICVGVVTYITKTVISYWPLVYLAGLSMASWIIDKKYRIEKYSLYTIYGVLTLIPMIFYQYGLRIETTVILAIMGFLSIYGGVISQRKNIRITGIITLMASLTKGTYDVIVQIKTLQISIMLKITASLMILGLLLIATSYLYLKLYKQI